MGTPVAMASSTAKRVWNSILPQRALRRLGRIQDSRRASAPKTWAKRRVERRALPARGNSSKTWAPIASFTCATADTPSWLVYRPAMRSPLARDWPSQSTPSGFICFTKAAASTDSSRLDKRAGLLLLNPNQTLRDASTGTVACPKPKGQSQEIFMRFKLASSIGGFLLALLSGAALAQPAPERINAIYASIAGDHAALYAAQEMGLFRKYGLDVNLTYIAGAAQVIQTMMAGENQIATAGGSGVVDADFGGADLVAVAGMVNMPAFYIVVQPEVKTIQDLKGRAVGITRFGSSTDFTMRYILRKAGLEPDKDVPLLQLGGQPELAVAMEARRIFAAPMTPPAFAKALKAGAKIQIPPKTIGLSFPHVGIVVRKTYLSTHRQTVCA